MAAVMTAVPAATAVTMPLLTVATEVLELLHVIELAADDGLTVALSVSLVPVSIGPILVLLSVIKAATIFTVQVAVRLSCSLAVITAVPDVRLPDVTTPLLLTVATEVLEDDHVTKELSLAGDVEYVNCFDVFFNNEIVLGDMFIFVEAMDTVHFAVTSL